MDSIALAYGIGAAVFLIGVGIVGALYQSLEGSTHQSTMAYLAIIPGFAGLAYAGMALDVGTVTINGTQLVGLRYIDWLVTTPLLVGFVGYVAGASRRSIAGVMIADALMIVTGTAAVATTGAVKWGLFGVSAIFHVSLFAYLFLIFPKTVPETPGRIGLFSLLKNHIGALWIAYPFVWLMGPEGLGYATLAGVSLTYVFLDVLAKVPYVYFFYARRTVFVSEVLSSASSNSMSSPE